MISTLYDEKIDLQIQIEKYSNLYKILKERLSSKADHIFCCEEVLRGPDCSILERQAFPLKIEVLQNELSELRADKESVRLKLINLYDKQFAQKQSIISK